MEHKLNTPDFSLVFKTEVKQEAEYPCPIFYIRIFVNSDGFAGDGLVAGYSTDLAGIAGDMKKLSDRRNGKVILNGNYQNEYVNITFSCDTEDAIKIEGELRRKGKSAIPQILRFENEVTPESFQPFCEELWKSYQTYLPKQELAQE